MCGGRKFKRAPAGARAEIAGYFNPTSDFPWYRGRGSIDQFLTENFRTTAGLGQRPNFETIE